MHSRESRTVLRGVETLFGVGTASALSDGELIERFLGRCGAGAEDAFAALVERHGPMVLRVCLGVLHDPHAAEDAFQATFLILARRAGSIRDQGSVASWLFGVARRVAGRSRRERARRAAHERRCAAADRPRPDPDALRIVPEVHEEIERLPEKYRAPVVLCYLEGLTHDEAARQLQMPVGTVKVRLARARGRLRGRLARRGLAPTLLAEGWCRRIPGAIPGGVVDATIEAAARVAAGRAAGVSGPVAALVEGVLAAMFLTKLKTTAALVAAGLAMTLTSALVLSALTRPARSDQADPGDTTRQVMVETLGNAPFQLTTTQIANVQAFESVNLAPRSSGYLKNLKVDIGDLVQRGQMLAEIDAPEFAADFVKAHAVVEQAEARVARAKAGVMVAEASVLAVATKVDINAAVLEGAEAALRYREVELKRYRELRDRNAVPDQVVEGADRQTMAARSVVAEAKAQMATARAGVDEAKARLLAATSAVAEAEADRRVAKADQDKFEVQLGFTRIVAPIDGIVTRREFHSGDFVRSGAEGGAAPVLTIMRTDKMRVVVQVPDREAPLLDKGDPVTIRLDALGDREYRGKIARTAYAENPELRTLRAELDLDNADGRLRPGQYGAATIVLEDLGCRLTIPVSALIGVRGAGGDAACYRDVGGRAVRTPIRVGRHNGLRIEVLDGLKEGESVVTNPGAVRSDGQAIKARSEKSPKNP